MVPVMCNCANNRHGMCYGNVNVAEIREVMEARNQDGSKIVTPTSKTVTNERGERVVSQACPGYVAPSGTMFAGEIQGDRKISGTGTQTPV